MIPPNAGDQLISESLTCEIVGTLPLSDRCDYIQTVEDCDEHKGLVSYLEILYCLIKPKDDLQHGFGLLFIVITMLLLFLLLSIVADELLCPAIQMIVNVLGIGEHIAGVTLVAFANSAPDFFSSLVTLGDPSRQVYSDLLASCLFVICMVSGIIVVINPFRLYPFCILRDTLFVLSGVLLIDYFIANSNSVSVAESCVLLVMYIFYIMIVAFDQFILKRELRKVRAIGLKTIGDNEYSRLEDMRSEAFIELHPRTSSAGKVSINIDATRRSLVHDNKVSKNHGLFKQFLKSINPFDYDEWVESSCFGKFLIILKLPFKLIFYIVIPKADYEMDGHGWSKLLNTIQVFLMPFILCIIIVDYEIYDIPLAVYTLPITVPMAFIVFFTSTTTMPPKYHVVFAIYASVGAIAAIYILADEVCQIMFVVGTVLHCSTSFLAATVLAWGNGIGDLVSNIALSQQGYQRMGYAACYGAPIFNIFFSMGFYYGYGAIISPTGEVKTHRGLFGLTCFYFLVINSLLALIWSPITNFTARRVLGIMLLFQYMFFLFYCLLTEVNFIHSYSRPTFLNMLNTN